MTRNVREFESGQPVTLGARVARLVYFVSLLLLLVGIASFTAFLTWLMVRPIIGA